MDWLDLLAVQGTLKSLLQHHSSKASILRQLSHRYMTTGKTIALTRQTFVGKVMSLLLNMQSRLVITFLPRSKASFNFMAAITICNDSGAPQNKVWHCFHCFPIYFPWSVQLFATLWTGAFQAPLSTGFSREEYWSGLPFPSPIHTWLLENMPMTPPEWQKAKRN